MATLRQLKTFIATAEYRKMSEAAKQLYISQPTVSQIISDLEKEYGVVLFERYPRKLKLTVAGELFFHSAKEIVETYEKLELNMRSVAQQRCLKVGATLTIGNTLIAELIEQLGEHYPDINVSVRVDNTEHLEEKLVHNELDVALVEGIITREEIVTVPVMVDTLYLVCGKKHPFANKKTVTIEELRGQSFIMREKGSGTRAAFEDIMSRHHIPFKVAWECNGGKAIVDAVRHNLGLGFISERCVCEYIEKGEIFRIPVKDISTKRFFYFCYHRNHTVNSQMEDLLNVIYRHPNAIKEK
mgnify:CR=1 FL=1